MAYDKIIPIRSRLDRCLGYVQNEKKTGLSSVLRYIENPSKACLQAAINCELTAAFQQMIKTKRRWGKTGGVLGYHIIHSYAPGELTAEQAQAVGLEFAQRLLGEQYEAVVCTHIDRSHLHCHIVFNSVSFVDGTKYRNTFTDYFGHIRETSNAVSREYGLSVIEPQGGGRHYAEWQAERSGKATIRDLIRQDLDAAIAESFTLESLLSLLRRRGYTVKCGANIKHTAIKPPGGQRFVRLDSLGAGYTEDALAQRLHAQRTEARPVPITPQPPQRYRVVRRTQKYPPVKRGSFRALYLYYLYLLSPRKMRRQKIPFQTRTEMRRIEQYRQQFFLLQKYHIDTPLELELLADALQSEIDAQTAARATLYRARQAAPSADLDAQISAMTARLRPLRRALRLCGKIAENTPRMRCEIREVNTPKKQKIAPMQVRERRNGLWK